jgi:hypothetical protein
MHLISNEWWLLLLYIGWKSAGLLLHSENVCYLVTMVFLFLFFNSFFVLAQKIWVLFLNVKSIFKTKPNLKSMLNAVQQKISFHFFVRLTSLLLGKILKHIFMFSEKNIISFFRFRKSYLLHLNTKKRRKINKSISPFLQYSNLHLRHFHISYSKLDSKLLLKRKVDLLKKKVPLNRTELLLIIHHWVNSV